MHTPLASVGRALWVHWMRNALAHVPKGQRTMLAAALAPGLPAARRRRRPPHLRQVADQFRLRGAKPEIVWEYFTVLDPAAGGKRVGLITHSERFPPGILAFLTPTSP